MYVLLNSVRISDIVLNVADLAFCVLVDSVRNLLNNFLVELFWVCLSHMRSEVLGVKEVCLLASCESFLLIACEELGKRVHNEGLLLVSTISHDCVNLLHVFVIGLFHILVSLLFHVTDQGCQI